MIVFLAFLSQSMSETSHGYYLLVVYCRIFALIAKQILSVSKNTSTQIQTRNTKFLKNSIFLKYSSPKARILVLLVGYSYQKDRQLVNSLPFQMRRPCKKIISNLFSKVESLFFFSKTLFVFIAVWAMP